MIKKNYAELTSIEKAAVQHRKKVLVTFGKTYPAALVLSALLSLFGIFVTGDFKAAFTPAMATATSGLFALNAFMFVVLFFATYAKAEPGTSAGRDYLLCVSMVTVTYMIAVPTCAKLDAYVLPLSLGALVMAELSNRRNAVAVTLVTGGMLLLLFVSGVNDFSAKMTDITVSVLGGFVVALTVGELKNKHLSRFRFLLGACGVSFVVVPFIILCNLAMGITNIGLLYNPLWAYCAALGAVVVFTPLVAVFEGIFNIADDFRLDELTNLNQPLLKRLASEAPGTFNHSLVVGNLSEACAQAIGENPHLARAAAYYHDIGKLKAPIYFSENQSDYNPHDELVPEVSVSMITAHTVFGEILAKQYRLPPEIVAVCREHHGTSPVGYFYRKALNLTEEGDLSVGNYQYPGPKPQTKVSAIIMIADTVEAAMRAYTPPDREEFVTRVNKLVDEKLVLGQFDECPITLKELAVIKSTIIETLPRVQHGRVAYEKGEKKA